jgi:hypothetical protein
MKATCKVVKVVVSEDGTRQVVEKSNLTVSKAIAMRDKLSDAVLKQDWTRGEPIVSYMVEGTV